MFNLNSPPFFLIRQSRSEFFSPIQFDLTLFNIISQFLFACDALVKLILQFFNLINNSSQYLLLLI